MNPLLLSLVLLAAPPKPAVPNAADPKKASAAALALRQRLIDGFAQECGAGLPSLTCAADRGALHLRMLEDLRQFQRAQDASMLNEALQASTLDDPLVQIAALDYVSSVQGEATEAQRQTLHLRALALLNHPVPGVASRAARLLTHDADSATEALASQYQDNQKLLPQREPWEDVASSLPPNPAPARVPLYPKGERFIPLETDRSAAFITDDALEQVVAHFAKATGVQPLDKDGWTDWLSAHRQAYLPQFDPQVKAYIEGKDPEFNSLMQQVQEAVRDPKKRDSLEGLQKKIEAYTKAINAKQGPLEEHPGVSGLNLNPSEDTKVFVLEVKQDRAARIVVVYHERALGGTVYALAWDSKALFGKEPAPRPRP